MAKKRLFQLFTALEAQAGVVPAGLIGVANAKVIPKDPVLTYDIEQFEREVVRGSHSPETTISGVIEATCTFSVEMSGTTDAGASGTMPPWSHLLRACSMKQVTTNRMQLAATFGGSANVFEHGEIIDVGSGTKQARVIHDTWEGQTYIRFVPILGAIVLSDTITGLTNGATSTFVTAANAENGQAWYPTSHPTLTLDYASITGTIAQGDVLKGDTSGAIIAPIAALAAGPLTGIEFRILDGIVTSGETFTNQTQAGTVVNCTNIVANDVPTVSIALCEDSTIKVMKAARGTFTISSEIGKPTYLNFTFKGTLSSISDGVALTGVSYESPVPPKFMGVGFKLGSYVTGRPGYETFTTEHTPRVTSMTIDFGNEVNLQRDATQATGVLAAHITGTRKGTFAFDPEVRPEGSYPLLAEFRDGQPFRARIDIGTAAKNRFLITCKGVKPSSEGSGDRNGFATRDFQGAISSYRYNGSDGDHAELVISYQQLNIGF